MSEFAEDLKRHREAIHRAASPGGQSLYQIEQQQARDASMEAQKTAHSVISDGLAANFGPSPDSYDYAGANTEGYGMKPDPETGGYLLPNKFYNQYAMEVAGHDLVSGEHIRQNILSTPEIEEGLGILRASKTNTAAGTPVNDTTGLARIALSYVRQGKSYDDFAAAIPEQWNREQVQVAWRAANATNRQTTLAGQIDRGELTGEVQANPLGEEIPMDALMTNAKWIADAKILHQAIEGEDFAGDDAEIAGWLAGTMSEFNWNSMHMASLAYKTTQGSPEMQRAMYDSMNTWDNVDVNWTNTWMAAKNTLKDPLTYVGGGLAGAAAKAMSVQVAKTALRKAIMVGQVGAIEGGVYGAGFETGRQVVSDAAGEGFSGGSVALGGAVGAGAGFALGAGLQGALSSDFAQKLFRSARGKQKAAGEEADAGAVIDEETALALMRPEAPKGVAEEAFEAQTPTVKEQLAAATANPIAVMQKARARTMKEIEAQRESIATDLSPDNLDAMFKAVSDLGGEAIGSAKTTGVRQEEVYARLEAAGADVTDPTSISAVIAAMPDQAAANKFVQLLGVLDAENLPNKGMHEGVPWADELAGAGNTPEEVLENAAGLITDKDGITPKNFTALTVLRRGLMEALQKQTKSINAGNKSDEAILEAQNTLHTLSVVSSKLDEKSGEVGRMLNLLKMTEDARHLDFAPAIKAAITSSNVTPQQFLKISKDIEDQLAKTGTGADGYSFDRGFAHDAVEALAHVWKNNILSSPSTHIVNFTGNSLFSTWEDFAVHPMAAAIGAARRATGGQKATDGVHGAEVWPAMKASYDGMYQGFRQATNFIRTGESMTAVDKGEYTDGLERFLQRAGMAESYAKNINGLFSMSFKALQTGDELFKAQAFHAETQKILWRRAAQQKLEGPDAEKWILSQYEHGLPRDIYEAGITAAHRRTFTDQNLDGVLGMLTTNLRNFASTYPAFKFIMPFITTPANLFATAIENSPAAFASKRWRENYKAGGASKDIAIARMTLGTTVTAISYALYDQGIITGQGPENKAQREMLEKNFGWKPMSIFAGGKYHSIERLDPFVLPMFGMISFFDRAKYSEKEEDFVDAMMHSIFGVAELAFDSTYLTGIQKMVDAIGDENKLESWISSYGPGAIPYGAALRTFANVGDPVPREILSDSVETHGVLHRTGEKMAQSIPGVRDNYMPQRDWRGEIAVPETSPAWILTPFKVSKGKADKLSMELYKNDIFPSRIPNIINVEGLMMPMLSIDGGDGRVYDEMRQYIGRARQRYVQKLVQTKAYANLPDDEVGADSVRALELQKMLRLGRRVGLNEFLVDKLPEMVKNENTPLAQYLHTLMKENKRSKYGWLADLQQRAYEGTIPPEIMRLLEKAGTGQSPTLPPHLEGESAGPYF